ncbi:MAG TPA: nicotinate-nicotinamide nucleotide adenylyltransferase [Acidimicrobiales bacterium]|nr:nicotinate-nicotinamide nucleotide adenylyltransferase [Acidimicrobiales bacterium]
MRDRHLGLFGGTFDPPHLGHVAALYAASASARFDRIVVTVAGQPYRKGLDVLAPDVRLAMAHAAFDDIELVEVSDMEIRRPGPSYTIDTVRELLVNSAALDLIVGADLAAQLNEWHQADELRQLVQVGVVPRPGSLSQPPAGWRHYEIDMQPVDLSSTFIRDMSLSDTDLKNYLPESVIPLYLKARG